MEKKRPKRAAENPDGDFYVVEGCLWCCLPHEEAPELMNDRSLEFEQCYFRRQPTNDAERDQAINAVCVSCIEALRYGGRDPDVIAKLKAEGHAHLCDHADSASECE